MHFPIVFYSIITRHFLLPFLFKRSVEVHTAIHMEISQNEA